MKKLFAGILVVGLIFIFGTSVIAKEPSEPPPIILTSEQVVQEKIKELSENLQIAMEQAQKWSEAVRQLKAQIAILQQLLKELPQNEVKTQ